MNAYNEVKQTNVERAIIVSFAKDKIAYNTCEMGKEEIVGYFNEMFLPCLKIYNYQRRIK